MEDRMYISLSDDKHQMVRDSSKNALAIADIIVTQLLCCHHAAVVFRMQPFNYIYIDSICLKMNI